MTLLGLSSLSSEWYTPPDIFQELDAEFRFTLDPCAGPLTTWCARRFTIADDGLSQSWAGERVFMNPPYGRTIGQWMKKAYQESLAGATVVCLVPVRTDTGWWHEWAMRGEIRFRRGRIRFIDGSGRGRTAPPLANAVIVFRSHE